MRIFLLSCVFLLINSIGFAQDRPAYLIYDKKGREVPYDSMVRHLSSAQIVLFGEIHNNTLVHWLELQVAKSLYMEDSSLALGAEMFEADDQLVINEYLQGLIESHHLENEIKVWNNYATDYKPLMTFARRHALPFIATNVPRRYASITARKGVSYMDSLSATAFDFMAPLPIDIDLELPAYKKMRHSMDSGSEAHGHLNAEYMVQAQALKDATMAYFISRYATQYTHFLHINGAYHSDGFEGIFWYLKHYMPEATVMAISSVEVKDVHELPADKKGIADYVIAIPEDMTKSY